MFSFINVKFYCECKRFLLITLPDLWFLMFSQFLNPHFLPKHLHLGISNGQWLFPLKYASLAVLLSLNLAQYTICHLLSLCPELLLV